MAQVRESEAAATATPSEGTQPILRRVGMVLIVVGMADLAWMVHAVATAQSYSSSLNVFAVVAGVLLCRQSLRTARVVRFFAAFYFAGILGLVVVLLALLPPDLIRTYIHITPVSQLSVWAAFTAAALALFWWVNASLSAPTLEVALTAPDLGPKRRWHGPRAGFWIGASAPLLGAILALLGTDSATARRAVEQARAQRGPDYAYFVTSREWRSSRNGTHVRATVLAYTDASIESVEIEWHE